MSTQAAKQDEPTMPRVDPSTLPTEEERQNLRDSARGYLAQHWPPNKAPTLADDPRQVSAIWSGLAQQGFAALGSEPTEGGLREVLVIMEELGRAACPAPMIAATLANLALRDKAAASNEVSALLAALHRGEAAAGIAFGVFDGDPNAGSAHYVNGALTGKISFVEGVASATHLLVLVDGPALAMVKSTAAGLKVTSTAGLSVPALAQLEFDKTPASIVKLDPLLVEDLNRLSRLALVARSLGAATRCFEMVVEYAKERHQFGQPIAKFQAIQHKLANCLISLEGVKQTLWNAATSYDHGSSDWRFFASAAYAFASPALRQVSLETHHTFGAIGYAEEHEAPRHFRRTHGDLARHGGVSRAREELAHYLLDEGGSLPEYDFGPVAAAFRQEVRSWLAQHWGSEQKAAHRKLPFSERRHALAFQRALGAKGWIAIAWPKEFGGQARTPLEQLVYMEELEFAEAPAYGNSLQAPALMKFGTNAQQDKYLPAIRHGEINFCLGYSEPGAGSDLASLKTRAVRDGDEWVINGQKIWNSAGSYADYIWLAARTDPEAKPQQAGISVFIVPVGTPGITMHPSMAMYGRTFSNIFLDDVRLPVDALVGEVNGGWKILTAALADERMMMGACVNRTRRLFERVIQHIRQATAGTGPVRQFAAVRDRIGALTADIEAARGLLANCVRMAEKGKVPIHEAAMSKCFSGELMERFGEAALDLLGMQATLSEDAADSIADGELEQYLRQSMMFVIGGGTVEIQRNLIALRGLNLPR